MEKTIKEVFKDYNSNSFELNEAKIKTVNVFKKTGRRKTNKNFGSNSI